MQPSTVPTPDRDDLSCSCATCKGIHIDFIIQFGKWPKMSHADALRLQELRARREASWQQLLGRLG